MNLLDLVVKVGVDDQASDKIGGISTGAIAKATAMGNAIWDMTKSIASAGASAVKELVGGATEAYSSYEQLTGGVEKLFGSAAETVERNASQAYRTAGMSANKYMEQATSFSASLISSLDGDTQEAARLTDVAMRAMSDNVNVFGSNMSDVQNAFQGFAKQNYTMLDNLKLGYGGTQAEMQRLVKDAASYTDEQAMLNETVDAGSLSFDNIVKAIEVVQTHLDVTGTTAREGATTIEGSVNQLKAAWDNLKVAFADGGVTTDLSESIKAVMDSLGDVIGNVAPRVLTTVKTIAAEMPEVFAAAMQELPGKVQPVLDDLRSSVLSALANLGGEAGGIDLTTPLIEGVSAIDAGFAQMGETLSAIDMTGLFEGAVQGVANFLAHLQPCGEILQTVFANPEVQTALQTLADAFGVLASVLGDVLGAVLEAIVFDFAAVVEAVAVLVNDVTEFATSCSQFFGTDVPAAIQTMLTFFQQLPVQVAGFLMAAITTVVGWVAQMASNAVAAGQGFLAGVGSALAGIGGAVAGWLQGAISAAVSFVAQMASQAIQAGQRFFSGIQGGLNSAVSFVASIPGRIVGALGNLGGLLVQAGRSVMDGFLSGIRSAFGAVQSFVGGIADWIASHKGPIDYDRRLLIPAGKAIMGGLLGGLTTSFEGDVMPYVSAMGGRMAGAVSGVPAVGLAGAGAGGAGGIVVYGDVVLDASRIGSADAVRDLVDALSDAVRRA